MRTVVYLILGLWVSVAAADCAQDCVDRRPSRKGNSCMAEMCQRACALKAKHQKPDALSLSPDKKTLYLTGDIDIGFGAELDMMLETEDVSIPKPLRDANQSRSDQIQFLVLNSPGGDAKFAERLQKWLFKKGSSVKVIVPHNGICASACAEILRCAQNRVASETALIMHHPSFLAFKSDDTARGERRVNESNARAASSECAIKASESAGGKRIQEALLRGEETCYRSTELSGPAGYLDVEKSGSTSFVDGTTGAR